MTKVKATPRRGTPTRGKLRVIGTLTGAGFDAFDPRQEEVSVTLGDGTPVVCCTVPQMKWMKLFRRHYGFWDQKGMICPPLIDFNLNQTLSGGGFNIFGRNVALAPLASSDLRVSIRVGTSCATGTAPLRRKKSGALVFP